MGRKIEITINDVLYIGDTSPARDQLEMLTIASQFGLLAGTAKNVGDMAVVTVLSTLNMATIERLKELVLRKGNFKRTLDDVPVAENMFQDEIHNFLLLIGRALGDNIGPFWKLNRIGQDEEVMERENQT